MVFKFIVLAAAFGGFLPMTSPAPQKVEIAEEGDLNPQPLPPWTGDGVIQAIS